VFFFFGGGGGGITSKGEFLDHLVALIAIALSAGGILQ